MTTVELSPEVQAGSTTSGRRRLRPPSATGVALAVVFFCASVTPTLLPLSWLFQGLASGLSATTGYALGVVLGWMARQVLHRRRPGAHARALARRVLAWVAVPVVAVFLALGSGWQQDGYRLIGEVPPPRYLYVLVLPVALLVLVVLVAIARVVRALAAAAGRLLSRWVPARIATVVGAVAVPLLIVGLLDGFVGDAFIAGMDAVFRAGNGGTNAGVTRPTSPLLSGGPQSLVPWASLGRQGRDFVFETPSPAQIKAFTGGPAQQPIRTYVGLRSASTPRAEAALAVRELERAGGFDRSVLTVVTSTGTGWVDPRPVAALELAYGGDTATVAMQYSYLPSWMSFLVDRSRAEEAGRELFDQVYAHWSQLPAGHRPRLLVFGESLGALGAEAAFSGVADMVNRTDGVLLMGPPNSSPLHERLVAEREPGTPEALPVVDHGVTVRFAGVPSDLARPPGPWARPRVVYLQHASDPVLWWSPRLILHEPDWLQEPRGSDVPDGTRWYPVVTFWQTTAAMAYATHVPAGHGHNYGTAPADAWTAIAPPEGWSPARLVKLRAAVSELVRGAGGLQWLS